MPVRPPALPPLAVDAAIAVVCFLATITLPLKAARTPWWLYALAVLASLPLVWRRRYPLVVLSAGMGLTMAPSTASIMSSLPLAKAGVGSAMNDTNRELGGALGVAVIGSLAAGRYTGHLAAALGPLPAPLRAAASGE